MPGCTGFDTVNPEASGSRKNGQTVPCYADCGDVIEEGKKWVTLSQTRWSNLKFKAKRLFLAFIEDTDMREWLSAVIQIALNMGDPFAL